MTDLKIQESSKWVHAELRELISVLTDYTANGSFADLANNVTYLSKKDFARLVRLTDIRNEFKTDGIWVDESSYNFLAKSKLYGDEILIANVGAYAGYSFLFTKNFSEDATLGPNMFLIKFRNNVSNKLFYYLLNEPYLAKQLISKAISSAQPKLNKENVRSCIVYYPEDISEQERIAKALSDIDDLTFSMRKLIEKKKNIKQGVMQDLLSGKRRLKGFKEEWVDILLKEFKPQKGTQINKNSLDIDSLGYPVMNGGISPSGYNSEYNSEANTIIISEGGNSCGYVNFMNKRFWAGGHCYTLSIPEGLCIGYIFQTLKYYEPQIMALRTGSGLPNIKKSALCEFKITIPSQKEEQEAIATVLADMDGEIEHLESQLSKYEGIKTGMMQQLLTGKIRLI